MVMSISRISPSISSYDFGVAYDPLVDLSCYLAVASTLQHICRYDGFKLSKLAFVLNAQHSPQCRPIRPSVSVEWLCWIGSGGSIEAEVKKSLNRTDR